MGGKSVFPPTASRFPRKPGGPAGCRAESSRTSAGFRARKIASRCGKSCLLRLPREFDNTKVNIGDANRESNTKLGNKRIVRLCKTKTSRDHSGHFLLEKRSG